MSVPGRFRRRRPHLDLPRERRPVSDGQPEEADGQLGAAGGEDAHDGIPGSEEETEGKKVPRPLYAFSDRSRRKRFFFLQGFLTRPASNAS